jgi:GNAT superfamily N-acetyltransferase
VYGQNDALAELTHLQWKFQENPCGSVLVVCESNGQIIGFLALIPLLVKINDAIRRCAILGDAMVHPKFRRQGIYVAMGQYLFDEAKEEIVMSVAAGDSQLPTCRGSLKYHQFRQVGELPILKKYLRPLSVASHLWVYSKLTVTNLVKYFGSLFNLLSVTLLGSSTLLINRLRNDLISASEEQIKLREVTPLVFGEEFDRLWEETQGSFPIAVVRNKQYLNWRYSDPSAAFVGFRADQGGVLQGYAVLSYTIGERLKTARIVDILAARPEIAAALVKECLRRAKQDQAHVLIMFETRQTQSFSKHLGLARSLQRDYFFAVVFDPEIPENLVYKFSNWYVTVADAWD